MNYGMRTTIVCSFKEAIEKTKDALTKEGFGILTEIDVRATLKKKLGVDFENYFILGVCNPSFAYEALKAEKEIGLLLPCNVILYGVDGHVVVSAIQPSVAMNMVK
ncbi:ABC transporter ATP-binding protein, partial [Candidatus Peregrinibacteria bacterium CG_4_9_14_0_2_um_filter_38_9]